MQTWIESLVCNFVSSIHIIAEHINTKMTGVKVRYATPAEYFAALFKDHSNILFPVLRHDFHPYADNEDSYWTGYYTSLPNLKKRSREAEAHLYAAETAYVYGRLQEGKKEVSPVLKNTNWLSLANEIQVAREELSVAQHHDAITYVVLYDLFF